MKMLINKYSILKLFYYVISITFITSSVNHSILGQSNILTGIIKDNKTKEVLPGCSILVNNSTIGTSSDSTGVFYLEKINLTEIDILFKYIGYKTLVKKVNFNDYRYLNLEIELESEEISFSELLVSSKRDKVWEKQFAKFKLAFLGNSSFAKVCKITNPWVLNFQELNGILEATATEPLIIINNALGYKIDFEIKSFKSGKENFKIQGNAFFKQLNENNLAESKKWESNREIAYKYSFQYFFKSLLDNKLKENGFELFAPKLGSALVRSNNFYLELDNSIVKFDPAKSVQIGNKPNLYSVFIPQNLEIHNKNLRALNKSYGNIDHSVSWISINNNNSQFYNNGLPLIPKDIFFSGDMNFFKFSGLLPLDFNPNNLFFQELNQKNDDLDSASFTHGKKNLKHIPENLFIHIDKQIYRKGEYLWFKIYQFYPSQIPNDQKSGVLYIDLFNQAGKIIESKIIKSNNGMGWGEFQLNDSLKSGNYCLRAYSNLMIHYNDSLQNYSEFKVIDGENTLIPEITNLSFKDFDRIYLENDKWKKNDKIELKFFGIPNSSYSISVINDNKSPFVFSPPIDTTIYLELKKNFRDFIEHRGRTFFGIIPKKPYSNVFNFGNNLTQTEVITTDENGTFKLYNIIQNDSIRITLAAKDSKNKEIKELKLIEKPKPPFIYKFKNFEVKIDTQKLDTYFKKFVDFDLQKIIELEELEVKGRKFVNPLLEKQRKLLGYPNKSFSTEDLIKSSAPNILMTLTSKLPNLKMVYNVESHLLDIRWTRPGLITPLKPTIWLDGFEISNPNDLQHISAEMISRIDVYTGPVTVANAQTMISIYTKTFLNEKVEFKNSKNSKKVFQFSFLGLSVPKIFYLPKLPIDNNRLNLLENRSTIYWNANLFSNEKGELEIDFFAIGKPGKYRVEIVGFNEHGQLGRQMGLFEIY
jgi:hypothetical protein